MKTIKQWFDEGGTFEEGLGLLRTKNRNRFMLDNIERRRDIAKLRYELSKFYGSPTSTIRPVRQRVLSSAPLSQDALPSKPHERLKIIRDGAVNYNNLPAELQPVYDKVCDQWREMRTTHEQMKLVKTDAVRAALRQQLLKLATEHDKGWEVIDHWGATGELPKSSGDSELGNPKPNYNVVNAAKANLSRYLKSIDKITVPAKRDEQLGKIRKCVATIRSADGTFKEDTLTKLKSLGIE